MAERKSDIGFVARCDGMGEKCEIGSYVRIAVFDGSDEVWSSHLISLGAAEELAAEILASTQKGRD